MDTKIKRTDGGAEKNASTANARPLIMDVDGTLVRSDLSFETLLAYLRPNFLRLFRVLSWLVKGRASVKRRLAEMVSIDCAELPMNENVVEFARAEAATGRPVFLATGSDQRLAEQLAERLDFVTGVFASDGATNLKGANKAKLLTARFADGFDYAGNSAADLAVWRHANGAILVATTAYVECQVTIPILARFPARSRIAAIIDALRVHQWAKNILVFVPLFLSGGLSDPALIDGAVLAFVAMNAVASASYLINDIWDLPDDRRHWSKKNRPFASGALPISTGLWAILAFVVLGFFFGALVSRTVVDVLAVYFGLTLAYSFALKRIPMFDGLVLATLFTLRLVLGAFAVDGGLSNWLLVFSMFLFASLSYAKRYTEIERTIANETRQIAGRGYRGEDAPLVLAVGVAAGVGAVLIMVLYLIEDAFKQTFYGNTFWLWGFPPLIFLFVGRLWILCRRGEMHDDPVAFAVKDRVSLVLLALMVLCFFVAWLGPEG